MPFVQVIAQWEHLSWVVSQATEGSFMFLEADRMRNLSLSFDMSAEHFSASALKDSISFKTAYQLTDTLCIQYLKLSNALNVSWGELFLLSSLWRI